MKQPPLKKAPNAPNAMYVQLPAKKNRAPEQKTVRCQNVKCHQLIDMYTTVKTINELDVFNEDIYALICPICEKSIVQNGNILYGGIHKTSKIRQPQLLYGHHLKSIATLHITYDGIMSYVVSFKIRKSKPVRGVRLNRILQDLNDTLNNEGFISKQNVEKIITLHGGYIFAFDITAKSKKPNYIVKRDVKKP